MSDPLPLSALVEDFAACMKRIDSRRPVALNARTKKPFQPGIGPHSETATTKLVANELQDLKPEDYAGRVFVDVPYPGLSRQKCDLCIGEPEAWDWCIEIKMLRQMGDNGKRNDNILMHILSPYPQDRSALTDCTKLVESGFVGRKAILIYGYDFEGVPLDPAIDAFDALANRVVRLNERETGLYGELVHPVHREGRVFAWEVAG